MTAFDESKIRSRVTDRVYDPLDMVYITNYMQAAAYIECGACCYDVLAKNKRLTLVFSKDETREMYHKWRERTLL